MPGTTPTALARTAVADFFDDASLFPPARAPMEAALGLHALASRSSWGFALGRFLVPLRALDTLVAERRHLEYLSPLEIGVIVGSPADPTAPAPLADVPSSVARIRAADPGLSVTIVEYRPADQSPTGLQTAAAELADVATSVGAEGFVEVAVAPHGDDVPARVAALRGAGVGAKVRCGGIEPAMVPDPTALAQFVAASVQDDLRFKATAGLHRALSAVDPERRFGYLNLLVATVLAHGGADVTTIATTLAFDDVTAVETTADVLRLAGHEVNRVDVAAARSQFVAFGTCSFTEPLADLLAIPGTTSEDR